MEVLHPASFITVITVPKSEIDYIDFDLCSQPKETLGHYYNRQERKPEILINGGFFSMSSGETCFTFVDDEELVKLHQTVNTGFGLSKDDKKSLIFGTASENSTQFYDFIAGYPVLVQNGKALSIFPYANEINYSATRTAIGKKANGDIVIIGVSKPGAKLDELANLMAAYGCEYAINLDGGGSSRLMVNGEVVNVPTENRSVDSVIAIYLLSSKPIEDTEPVDDRPYISYTVKSGDSMWKISTEYLGSGSRYKEIMEFNGLTSASLRVGQVLKIPVDCEKYVVKSGDTLWRIASEKLGSGARYKEIMTFNNLTFSTLSVGQIIYIPV